MLRSDGVIVTTYRSYVILRQGVTKTIKKQPSYRYRYHQQTKICAGVSTILARLPDRLGVRRLLITSHNTLSTATQLGQTILHSTFTIDTDTISQNVSYLRVCICLIYLDC